MSGSAEPRRLCAAVCRQPLSRLWPESSAGVVAVSRWGECFERREGGDELGRPRLGVLEVELAVAAGEREPGSDLQRPAADPFRFCSGELAVEEKCLGPDQDVVQRLPGVRHASPFKVNLQSWGTRTLDKPSFPAQTDFPRPRSPRGRGRYRTLRARIAPWHLPARSALTTLGTPSRVTGVT